MKLVNEPLFKDNKRKEHTIIHNRNASAINNENRGKNHNEDDGQLKNKKKKESSMTKFARKNINNANNIELKNNLKTIKKDNIKEKEKDKNINKDNKEKNKDKKGVEKEKEKERKINSSIKKRNISMTKRNSKDDKTKKNAINLKKIIPKPPSSSIKKNLNTSSAYTLKTTSNSKTVKASAFKLDKHNMKTPNKNLDKTHFEPIYKKLDRGNANIKNNKNEAKTGNGKLKEAIQLSDVKKTNKKSKIPYDKNSNKKYKKNIRITIKNIEEEDINDNNEASELNSIKNNKKHNINITFSSNLSNNSITKKGFNSTINIKKNAPNNFHSKSNRGNYTKNNGKMYSSNNEMAFSHRNINNFHRNISHRKERNIISNKNRYQSVTKTERNKGKTKKFLDMTAYEGNKTEIASKKKGNPKFFFNNKCDQNHINNYYGPIDINNIVIGNSTNEINEKIIQILNKNKVKHWKINPWKLYCNKNGEIFVIEIFVIPNKIAINGEKSKEENEISEFDIKSNIDNNEENEKKDDNINNNKNNKSQQIFYITVLSKDSSNKQQAKKINKIINKKFKSLHKK